MNAISVASGAIAKGGKRAQFFVVAGALLAAFLLYSSLTGSKTTTSTKPLAAKTAAVAAAIATGVPAARTVTPAATYELTTRDPFSFAPSPDAGAAVSTMGGRIAASEQLLLGVQGAITPVLSGRSTFELQDADIAAALPGVTIVAKDAAAKTSAELSYSATTDRIVFATRAEAGDCFYLRLSKGAGQEPLRFARVTMTAAGTCQAGSTEAVTFASDQVTAGWVSVG